MKLIRIPTRLFAAVIFAFLALHATDSFGQGLFEFCDDFWKSACCQRDPWEERIETERHDFTQSATTVGRGVMQIESGYSYFYRDAEETESSHTGPEMLLRLGISEDIEFRLRWNYAWKFIEDQPDETGAEDLRYSLKLQMTRGECGDWLPTSALEIRGSAPTGGEAFSTDGAEFGLDYIYQWQLNETTTVAGSTGFGTDGLGDFGLVRPNEPGFSVFTQSAVLGMELTDSNTIYTEWFGLYSNGLADEFDLSFVNVGIDHYVTDNFVLDIRLGLGLTGDSDDFFSGVGGGYRF